MEMPPPNHTLLDSRQSSGYWYPQFSTVPFVNLGTKLSGMLRKVKRHSLGHSAHSTLASCVGF